MGWPTGLAERRGEVVLLILAGAALVFTMVIMRKRDGLVAEIVKSIQKPVVAPQR